MKHQSRFSFSVVICLINQYLLIMAVIRIRYIKPVSFFSIGDLVTINYVMVSYQDSRPFAARFFSNLNKLYICLLALVVCTSIP